MEPTREQIESFRDRVQWAPPVKPTVDAICALALRALDADAELARRDAARAAIRKRHEDYTPGMLLAALEATEAALRESEHTRDAAAADMRERAAMVAEANDEWNIADQIRALPLHGGGK
jgi:hypothetical protein